MSIVALKRNSRRFQDPISANGFSLNGGYRNQRSIYSTNLTALTTQQDNTCGYGNDPSIVKLSTKNTKGLIYSTIIYPTCNNGRCGINGGAPIWVKNFSPDDKSQNEYIKNTVQASVATCNSEFKTTSGTSTSCDSTCRTRSYFIGGRRVYITFNAKNSGSPATQGALTAGEYLKAGLLRRNCLPTPNDKKHFPPSLNHNGCDVNANTPAEAKALGLIPITWTG
jgi:hypothetical protein